MKVIWATGGRSWGFRFLLDGGYSDPLPIYERAFAGLQGEAEACRRVGEFVALRFPDPEGREDTSGRVIPHDFVIPDPLAGEFDSVPGGLQVVWPLVCEAYARVWDSPRPPSGTQIEGLIDTGSRLLVDGDDFADL